MVTEELLDEYARMLVVKLTRLLAEVDHFDMKNLRGFDDE